MTTIANLLIEVGSSPSPKPDLKLLATPITGFGEMAVGQCSIECLLKRAAEPGNYLALVRNRHDRR
jgi:hypothetical protein